MKDGRINRIGGIAGGIDCRHGHGMPYTESGIKE